MKKPYYLDKYDWALIILYTIIFTIWALSYAY